MIKTWTKTQSVLAKSSAQSELYGVVKGAVEGLGVCNMIRDSVEGDSPVRIHFDATAAKGITERKGLSKVRHIDTDVLWHQEQQTRRCLPVTKVLGTEMQT